MNKTVLLLLASLVVSGPTFAQEAQIDANKSEPVVKEATEEEVDITTYGYWHEKQKHAVGIFYPLGKVSRYNTSGIRF
ncbi:MAG: hypothetical protein QNL04_12975 [SAR324 cluster bacterium]|nr:hypothetical protein [SAR324 cluster bacterium]